MLGNKPKLSSSSFNAADRKERTPYRLQKNKSRYLGDSNDSGYLTTASSTNGRTAGADFALVDDNYPLDYGGSRYRSGARNYGTHYDHRYHDEYDPSTSRYARQGEYASSYKPRSGLDYSNYYDGSRLGGPNNSRYDSNDISASTSAATNSSALGERRQRAYGRNKTSDSLVTAAGEASAAGRQRYEPPPDEFVDRNNHPLNSRNRFAHKRPEVASVGSSTHRPATSNKLTEEELEILNDDRSSADNAAILIALRDDGQYLEAKKFEERMRKRTELKERMARYAQEAEKAKELQKALEEKEKELEKEKEKEREKKRKEEAQKQDANNNNAEIANKEAVKDTEKSTATECNGLKEEDIQPKKRMRSKKVTNETDSSTSSEEEDEEESETSSDDNTQSSTKAIKPTTTTSTTTSTTQNSTTTTNTLSNSKPSIDVTKNKDQTDAKPTSNTSRFLNNDKLNYDLSKYRPQPLVKPSSTSSSTSGLMHSSSSGALAFGGISERLGLSGTSTTSGRQQKPYTGAATSRTAAVLSEFENSGPASRYPATRDHYLDSYKSSYLYDPYTSAYGPSSSSSRRPTATGAAGASSTLTAYQRQQLQAYQQQQHYQQQHQLSKSATSSSLFHRSRIPKTYSSFVRIIIFKFDVFSYLKIYENYFYKMLIFFCLTLPFVSLHYKCTCTTS